MPLSVEQMESLRRSNAMGSLRQSQIDELIETAVELARRQREIDKDGAVGNLGAEQA